MKKCSFLPSHKQFTIKLDGSRDGFTDFFSRICPDQRREENQPHATTAPETP
jgi:hypothetical protein